ncbi:MAG: SDR family oxidoreductase [Gemmatimonadaceae bacterium]|nr:SDR family oxidoreductase [Gemmatimonadaceae bacterium]
MRFSGKNVVITGVGRAGQVGEAVAAAFGAEGARLALVDVMADEARARAGTLVARGIDASAHACDLTDGEAVQQLATTVRDAMGGVDALVCVAGGFAFSGPIDAADPAIFHRQVAINLTTAWMATRAFVPLLRERKGAITYFTSAAAIPGGKGAGMSAYVAAKAGVLALMQVVAQEEQPHGVRANALAPTAIRTAANLADMGDSFAYVEREEVAATVLWLASDEGRRVTGQVLRLGA